MLDQTRWNGLVSSSCANDFFKFSKNWRQLLDVNTTCIFIQIQSTLYVVQGDPEKEICIAHICNIQLTRFESNLNFKHTDIHWMSFLSRISWCKCLPNEWQSSSVPCLLWSTIPRLLVFYAERIANTRPDFSSSLLHQLCRFQGKTLFLKWKNPAADQAQSTTFSSSS